jgi:hypothetical protein
MLRTSAACGDERFGGLLRRSPELALIERGVKAAALELRDVDEAIAWSERTPWNKDGCYTEIRPIMDYAAWEAEAAGAEQTAS